MAALEFVRTIARTDTSSAKDDSFSGIAIFCRIGLLLGLAALVLAGLGKLRPSCSNTAHPWRFRLRTRMTRAASKGVTCCDGHVAARQQSN